MMTIGERIKLARTIEGISLRQLSSEVQVTHQAISKYENNKSTPSSDVLLALADALNVKLDFFFRSASIDLTSARYRKRARLSKRESKAVLGRVREWVERYVEAEYLVNESLQEFRMPEGMAHTVSSVDDAEIVAKKLREAWQLGCAPIDNLTELLEDKGIRIGLVEGHEDFDACAIDIGNIPVIAVKASISGDRQRFSLAHELGHIIMDVDEAIDEEKVANRFAGAFLVPAEAAQRELGNSRSHIHIGELQSLKLKYGFSMQAWIYRAKDLGIISSRSATSMFRKFRSMGRQEPGSQLPIEYPKRMERMVLKALAEGIISEPRASELLRKPIPEILGPGLSKESAIL